MTSKSVPKIVPMFQAGTQTTTQRRGFAPVRFCIDSPGSDTVLYYRRCLNGKQKWVTPGRYPVLSLRLACRARQTPAKAKGD